MSSSETLVYGRNISDFNESFDLAKRVSDQMDSEISRDILIQVAEAWDRVNADTLDIWTSLLERVGFYPYIVNRGRGLGLNARIRMNGYKSKHLDGIYFHSQQKAINDMIERGKNLAVSAPTSFGKSLLIEEVIASNKFDNVLIIQPTLALIDETRQKMKKYSSRYRIITNTAQEVSDRNVFILTAERVLELESMPKIGLFVVDEFYKIANKFGDERQDALNVAIYRVNTHSSPQMLLLAPTVDSISKEFRSKYDVEFFRTDYSLVRNDVEEVRCFGKNDKELKLFELLSNISGPSLVYVSSPKRAYELALKYLDFLDSKNEMSTQSLNLPVFEWIDNNISPDWNLKKILSKGIGIHNGQLPRHLITDQLKHFEDGNIKVMFITTSLIEGVNTTAKNMIIYDLKKGSKKINFFDYSNIKGRAGRLNQYFTGKTYVFGQIPDRADFSIDVPFVEQQDASDVIIVSLNRNEVKSEKLEHFDAIVQDVPDDLLKIIKKNAVSVSGQKGLYAYLIENKDRLRKFLSWRTMPSQDQLKVVMRLGFRFLYGLNDNQSDRLVYITNSFVRSNSMKGFIASQIAYRQTMNKNMNINNVIVDALEFIRRDAGYKIPKVLGVVQSIQQYVYKEEDIQGDYTLLAARLEGGGVDSRMRIFVDAGIPQNILIKLSNLVPGDIVKESEIIEYIRDNEEMITNDLIEYERRLIIDLIH